MSAAVPRRVELQVWRHPAHAPERVGCVVRDPAATVAELAEALGAAPGYLFVDGRPASPTATLAEAGVRQGSAVAVPPGAALPDGLPEHGPHLQVVAGLGAGRVHVLALGAATVGTGAAATVALEDRTAAQVHARLDVAGDGTTTVAGAGGPGGVVLAAADGGVAELTGPAVLQPGDELRVGATRLRFGTAAPEAPAPAPGGVVHRPPRRIGWVAPQPVPPPSLPQTSEVAQPLSIAAMLTPILFAVVMVLLLHSIVYAAFGLLSPVAFLGTWLEGRRRARRGRRRRSRAVRDALAAYEAALEAQRRAALVMLTDLAPPPAELRARAEGPTPRLWERRPGHPDHLVLGVATGSVPWSPPSPRSTPVGHQDPAGGAGDPDLDEVRARVAARGVPAAVVDLRAGWVGVAGPRPAAVAVARALVLQAATTTGPADLAVLDATGPDRDGAWSWLGWLPHLHDDPPAGRQVLAVVDGPGDPSLAAPCGVAVAEDVTRLPSRCRTVVHVDDAGGATVEDLDGGRPPVTDVLATGVPPDVADRWARALAALRDAEDPAGRVPERVDGSALWAPPPGPGLGWVLGEDAAGPVIVDLAGDDPHVLIGAVPGAGATEALRGLACSLSRLPPSAVELALVDLAGGGLGPLAALPHSRGLVTDIGDRAAAGGPLARLEGEVARREGLVRGAGFDTLAGMRLGGGPELADLVVVVDDPGTLPFERQSTLEALVALAAGASHLGVHVALATTAPTGRAAGALSGVAARLALRLAARPAEDLVGTAAPAAIPRSRPGRGWLAIGDRPAAPVQLASTAAPWVPPERRILVEGVAGPGPAGPTVLEAVVAAAAGAPPAPPLWGSLEGRAAGLPPASRLAELLGATDLVRWDPDVAWAGRAPADALRVPIGRDDRGDPMVLDLKEAALGGMGPHGLVVGATGSGKSELLRTLVCSLVATHGPEDLGLVLVDFKGGATFAGFADLPHVAGVITNLEDDAAAVDRMAAALLGEQDRRQELLRAAGNLTGTTAYRQVRRDRPDLPVLPELLVIVDEFAELLEQRPELLDTFASIGRLGRSLGLHLLLATQRLEEGRLRGLDSHLRYRIGLRTTTPTESRVVLGAPDAASLPSEPGAGYLRVDAPTLERFRAALVSGGPGEAGDLEALVGRVAAAGAPRTHQVWLPVLPPRVSLVRLLGAVGRVEGRGLQVLDRSLWGSQRAVVGVIDRPRRQSRGALVVDLAGAAGHLLVVGAPRTGKTTALRAVAAALALTCTPLEAHLYGLDLAGGGLSGLAGLPHCGGVADRADPELVGRVISHVSAVVTERRARWRAEGIGSVERWRRTRSRPGDGDVYLLVDGWHAVRDLPEAQADALAALAADGLGVGVHLLVATPRWSDVRPAVRDLFAGRLELRLTDPFESLVDRHAADLVPPGTPGRGVVEPGEHVLVALPAPDEAGDPDDGWAAVVAEVAAAWDGPPALPVRLLPTAVPLTAVPAAPPVPAGRPGPGPLAIGVAEPDLGPAVWDPAADGHLLVLGDSGSGRTTALRAVLAALVATTPPERAKVLVVDPRRGLLDALPPTHAFAYAGSAQAAATEVARLRTALDERLPGPDVGPDALRARSWWQGADAVVVVDDHDLLVSATANPLLGLVDLLAHARDVGLHVVLARRVAGWQRGQYEPFVQRLREVGTATLVLSGDPAEGPLAGGVRAVARPPGRGQLVVPGRAPVVVQVAQA